MACRALVLTILLLGPGPAPAQHPGLPGPDPGRLRQDVAFLCRPELAGRETGTPGAEQAAAYVARQMEWAGLVPIRPGGLGGATPYHHVWTYQAGYGAEGGGWTSRAGAGVPVANIVGVIPGRDPALRGEYIFVSAHLDHLGRFADGYYPGADDDASGTAALLEVLRLLRGAQPRRNLAFLATCGEEEGLLGSEAFLRQPPVPLEAIKADINLDMVGRGRDGELHVMPARQEGQVSTLTRDARDLAPREGIVLSAGMEGYWRDSDHFSFGRRGIPAICFITGLHEDYHQPTDTPDKIDFAKLACTVSIVRDLALRTADADTPPGILPAEVWSAWAWGPYRDPGSPWMPLDPEAAIRWQ